MTINIGIVAHIDAGKTTLTEHILYESGIIKAKGRVDHANTVTDDLEAERKRGITIREKTVSFVWNGTKVNLLDTPGHSDFFSEVVRAFQVLDLAILVISAKEGVQAQTIAIYNMLEKIGIPVVIFINKLDRIGADVARVRQEIGKVLGVAHVMMRHADEAHNISHWQTNPEYVEENLLALMEFDGNIIDAYYAGQKDIDGHIYQLARKNKLCPVFMGIATAGIGVRELMDEICKMADPAAPAGEPSAIVYKVDITDKHVKKTYFRMYRGAINQKGKDQEWDTEIQVPRLETMVGAKLVPTNRVVAGDIGVLTNANLKVGDIIGVKCDEIIEIPAAVPIFMVGIRPAIPAQRRELLHALSEMSMQDTQMDCTINSDTNEISLRIYGDIQKEFIRGVLLDKYGIQVEFTPTITVFKETPVASGMAEKYIGDRGNCHKASANHHCFTNCGGCNFHRAGVKLIIEPLARGEGVRYQTAVSFGDVTKSFQNGVEEGVMQGLKRGLYGWGLTDIAVTFAGFDFDSVTSTPKDFRNLAAQVLSLALKEAGTQLLEPVYYYEIIVPADLCGKVVSDIEALRGAVDSIENHGDYLKMHGKLPSDTYQSFMERFVPAVKNMGVFDVVRTEYEPYSS